MNHKKIEEALRIAGLIKQQTDGSISPEDQASLDQWINHSEHNRMLFKKLTDAPSLKDGLLELEKYNVNARAESLFGASGLTFPPGNKIAEGSKVRRLRLYKWIAAASVILILGGITFLAFMENKQVAVTARSATVVVPGGNKAVLTLADGSRIVLDSVDNGTLSRQGKTDIMKVQSGQLVYKSIAENAPLTFNAMSTPRGGTYRLVLADGTKVWLNSASSIRYPVAFVGKERQVALTGEAYFEVAHNASMPFKVMVSGTEIQVLGTHFNVNAYKEEPGLRATLLEGSIKLLTSTGKSVIIKPGQQAEVDNDNHIKINNQADIGQVIAWQKGMFEFDNTPLTTIMGQISRWYNVDVVYEGLPGNEVFGGGINKNQPLSTVLKLLEASGVHFNLEGRTLIVKPQNK